MYSDSEGEEIDVSISSVPLLLQIETQCVDLAAMMNNSTREGERLSFDSKMEFK